jgi:hypothetical protein
MSHNATGPFDLTGSPAVRSLREVVSDFFEAAEPVCEKAFLSYYAFQA